MSGPSALAICDTVFSGARRAGEAAGYTVLYGTIADGARVLDDVLVTVFRAPHSYTGEDAVEISCHGSRYIVRELLALLVRRGARMATPGEFTSRAFLGGKLDLSQAEAVADLIASGSRAAHTLATDQMRGGYPPSWKRCAASCCGSPRCSNSNSISARKRSNSPTARNSAPQWSGSVRRSTG